MYIFLISLFLLFFVFIRKKINLYNIIHWIFLGFMILYNILPLLVYKFIPKLNTFKRLSLAYNNLELLNKQLIVGALCILIYIIYILFKSDNIKLTFKKNKMVKIKINLVFLYFIILPIGIYLNYKNNWTTGSRTGLGPSLTAYVRNFLEVLGLMIFTKYHNNNKIKLSILFTFIVLSFIGTQRTNMMILFVGYLITMKKSNNIIYIFLVMVSSLAILGCVRNGVSILRILYPFIGEGIFGSYGMLQAVKIVEKSYSFSNVFLYLNSLLNKIFSFIGLNLGLKTIGNVANYMKSLGILREKYFPMGGYYFPADAHIALPYIGPMIQMILFMIIIEMVCKYKKDVYLKIILYSNLFLLFKANLSVIFALVLFQIISYYFIRILNIMYCYLLKNYANKVGFSKNENTT